MKILALPDLHLRMNKPKNRKDEDFYSSVVLKKFQWIQDFAINNGIKVVVTPGDFFDSATVPKRVVGDAISILYPNSFAKVQWLGALGQHDLVNHSPNIENTPFRILEEAKVITRLTDSPISIEGVNFYGASWGEEVPEVTTDGINVLAIHKMIVADEKEWEAQEGHIWGLQFLRRNKFDYIISGDNHRSFHIRHRSKHLINCGTLIRNKTDMIEYKPCVYLIDTEKKTVKKTYVPIQHDVFQEANTKVEKLAQTIKTSFEVGLNFRENVFKKMEDEKIKGIQKEYILKALGVENGYQYRDNVSKVSGFGGGNNSGGTGNSKIKRRKVSPRR